MIVLICAIICEVLVALDAYARRPLTFLHAAVAVLAAGFILAYFV